MKSKHFEFTKRSIYNNKMKSIMQSKGIMQSGYYVYKF